MSNKRLSTPRSGLWRHLVGRTFWTVSRLGFVWPAVMLCKNKIEEVAVPNSSNTSGTRATILALNPDRFRGDLEILAATGEFRILKAPFEWQARLLGEFYPPDTKLTQLMGAEGSSITANARRRLHKFLRRFLRTLYRTTNVQCVIGAAIHYRQDVDWGAVSAEIGVPYVVLHRENLLAAPEHCREFIERGRSYGKFLGSHLIVHNEIAKRVWSESGFVAPEHVSVIGCLRMEPYLQRVRSRTPRSDGQQKRACLFSFGPGTGLFGLAVGHWPTDPDFGLVQLCKRTHVAFGELARAHPDIEFIIKPKWDGKWIESVEQILREAGIVLSACPNLKFLPDADAHDLILNSDVVIGYASTTLLEAAVAGTPVIMPYFDEALAPEFSDHVSFRDERDVFDVANSPEQLKLLVVEKLNDPSVDAAQLKARTDLFERYVCGVEETASAKLAGILKHIIADTAPHGPGAVSPHVQ